MYTCVYTCVSPLYSMIVTGDAAGCVKFFDNDLKMLNWYVRMHIGYSCSIMVFVVFVRYDSLKFGPIVSISFAHIPNSMKLNP